MKRAFIALALIQLALVVVKLTGHLPISWYWIFTPVWVPIVLLILFAIVGIALLGNASRNGENPFN